MDTLNYKSTQISDSLNSVVFNKNYSSYLESLQVQNSNLLQIINKSIEQPQENERLVQLISNDTLFTIIITLFIFGIGQLSKLCYNMIIKRSNQRKLKDYTKNHIDKIICNCKEKLVVYYAEVSKETNIDTGILMTPPQILTNDFFRFKNIDSKDLFDAVKEKKDLSVLYSHIDYIDHLIPEVKSYHSNVLAHNNKLREKIGITTNEYTLLFVRFGDEIKGVEGEQTIYNYINDKIHFYHKEIAGNNKLQLFFDKVVWDTQLFLVKNEVYKRYHNANIIVEKGKEISIMLNDLKNITKTFSDEYKKFSKALENSIDVIEQKKNKINW